MGYVGVCGTSTVSCCPREIFEKRGAQTTEKHFTWPPRDAGSSLSLHREGEQPASAGGVTGMGVEDDTDRLYRNKVILAPMVRAVSSSRVSLPSSQGLVPLRALMCLLPVPLRALFVLVVYVCMWYLDVHRVFHPLVAIRSMEVDKLEPRV